MPNAGDAFLNGAIPVANNPLNRLNSQVTNPLVDPLAMIGQWTKFVADTLLDIIKKLTGIDLAFLGQVFEGIDLSAVGSIIGAITSAIEGVVSGIIQQIIDAIVSALNGSPSTGNDPLALMLGLLNPLQWLQGLTSVVHSIQADLAALVAGHDGRLLTVEATLAQLVAGTATTVNSGGDTFNRAGPAVGTDWTNVSGSLLIKDSGYVQTTAFSAGYFNKVSPATDKHGVSVRLVNKFVGQCKAFICSDTAMSNFVAVEVWADFWGNDFIRLSVGSSPGVTIAQKQMNFQGFFMNGKLQNGMVLQLKYDDVANTFYVLKDGVVLPDLTWEDTDHLVTHDSTKRRCGIVSCADNVWAGFGITDFLNFDWT